MNEPIHNDQLALALNPDADSASRVGAILTLTGRETARRLIPLVSDGACDLPVRIAAIYRLGEEKVLEALPMLRSMQLADIQSVQMKLILREAVETLERLDESRATFDAEFHDDTRTRNLADALVDDFKVPASIVLQYAGALRSAIHTYDRASSTDRETIRELVNNFAITPGWQRASPSYHAARIIRGIGNDVDEKDLGLRRSRRAAAGLAEAGKGGQHRSQYERGQAIVAVLLLAGGSPTVDELRELAHGYTLMGFRHEALETVKQALTLDSQALDLHWLLDDVSVNRADFYEFEFWPKDSLGLYDEFIQQNVGRPAFWYLRKADMYVEIINCVVDRELAYDSLADDMESAINEIGLALVAEPELMRKPERGWLTASSASAPHCDTRVSWFDWRERFEPLLKIERFRRLLDGKNLS